jgi:hypothetical protein
LTEFGSQILVVSANLASAIPSKADPGVIWAKGAANDPKADIELGALSLTVVRS